MGGDDQRGSCGLETHSAFNADDGIAHVHIAADGIGGANFFHTTYGSYRVVVAAAVDGFQFSVLKCEAELLLAFFGRLFEISRIG